MVRSEVEKGNVPSDEQLRAKAREILRVENTAADNGELLEKFKSLHGISTSVPMTNGPVADYSIPDFTGDVSMLAGFDAEINALDLTTDFSTGVGSMDGRMNALSNPFDATPGMDGLSELKDYADAYRVHAATASPLRRRASERLARDAGSGSGSSGMPPSNLY